MDLKKRIAHLEESSALLGCTCGEFVCLGEPDPPSCPCHGTSNFERLPRSRSAYGVINCGGVRIWMDASLVGPSLDDRLQEIHEGG